jgi:hypothetical protein
VGGFEYIGRTMSLSWLCSAAVTASPPFVVMLSAPIRSP